MKLETELIKKELENKIFSVKFVKKDGTLRKMVARLGVTKALKGGSKSYDDSDKNHLTVYDLKKKAYRTINLNTVKEIRFKGKSYESNKTK